MGAPWRGEQEDSGEQVKSFESTSKSFDGQDSTERGGGLRGLLTAFQFVLQQTPADLELISGPRLVIPSISAIRRSVRRTSIVASRSRERASAPLSQVTTSYPSARTTSSSIQR